MNDLDTQAQIMRALRELVPGVTPGEMPREGRTLRWVEAGAGHPTVVLDAALGEPGTLAWAGVLPEVAQHTRAIAYDRAGIQQPGLVAGLVLVDPADEVYWESLPAQVHLDNQQSWAILEEQHAKGEHTPMITGVFGDFARHLSRSPQVQSLIQDALRTTLEVTHDRSAY